MNATRCRNRLLAGLLVLGAVGAAPADSLTQLPAVVYCKARLLDSGEQSGDVVLSVELPPTPGFLDPEGNPVTVWNVGDVVRGSVADTWHSGGPGYFTARNAGNVGAYVYVMAVSEIEASGNPYPNAPYPGGQMYEHLFPGVGPFWFVRPKPSPRDGQIGDSPDEASPMDYHLALTQDVTAIAPTWRPLEHVSYLNGTLYTSSIERQCSAYLAWMPVGEYQPFDLKFWAPANGPTGDPLGFVFRVEAATFPLWEHDR